MRKTYTTGFKAKIILELLREEQTLSQLAGKYEIHPNQLVRWRKAVVEGIPELLEDKRKKAVADKEHREQVQELYAQIGELTAKLNWLKKKSGIDVE
jgi:transposase-like protein